MKYCGLSDNEIFVVGQAALFGSVHETQRPPANIKRAEPDNEKWLNHCSKPKKNTFRNWQGICSALLQLI